jgi:uncharacterized membrane protein YhaH (DUF805 family)
MRKIIFKLFSWKGEIGRIFYAIGSISVLGVGIIWRNIAIAFGYDPALGEKYANVPFIFLIVIGLTLIYIHVVLNIKRFRNFGAERYWLFCLVPYVNLLVFVFMSAIKNTDQVKAIFGG